MIWPPVSVDDFEVVGEHELGDYYLMAGELVRYKRPDLAVEAFNAMGRKLVVIGGGEMLDEIRRLAGPSVTVLGPQPFSVLRHHYARCRALIFPGEEDFGMVPVEAMASGCPVVNTAIPGSGGPWVSPHDRTGLTVPVNDAAALAAGVEYLMIGEAGGDEISLSGDDGFITAVNLDTGDRLTVTTTDTGGYTLKVAPGRYRIDVELAKRKMSVGEFAEQVGLTPANVAVLKNGRAKAVRFSTLEAMCRVLDCQPGDLLEWVEDTAAAAHEIAR